MTGKNQYITDASGKKAAVILPVNDYKKMLDEYACIKAYDKTKSGKLEFAPAENVFISIEKKRRHN